MAGSRSRRKVKQQILLAVVTLLAYRSWRGWRVVQAFIQHVLPSIDRILIIPVWLQQSRPIIFLHLSRVRKCRHSVFRPSSGGVPRERSCTEPVQIVPSYRQPRVRHFDKVTDATFDSIPA